MYRGINECKIGYQPRNKLVKDDNGDLADLHNILNMLTNYFLSYWMCIMSVMLGRQKYIRLNH
jgi:hypothetical protein